MPTPLPGDGALSFTIGQVLPVGTLYLAPYIAATPTPAPGVALGATEPDAAFVKTGLLKDEQFLVTEKDPTIIDYRRGFRQRYFGEVVRMSGDREITCTMEEVEPAAIASITGETPTTVAGSPAGQKLSLGSSEYFHRTLLAVYFDDLSLREFHMYSPHVLVRYKLSRQAEFMTVDLVIKLIPFLVSGKYKDIDYYHF